MDGNYRETKGEIIVGGEWVARSWNSLLHCSRRFSTFFRSAPRYLSLIGSALPSPADRPSFFLSRASALSSPFNLFKYEKEIPSRNISIKKGKFHRDILMFRVFHIFSELMNTKRWKLVTSRANFLLCAQKVSLHRHLSTLCWTEDIFMRF